MVSMVLLQFIFNFNNNILNYSIATNSIAHAISFIRCIVLFCDPKNRSGSGQICSKTFFLIEI